MLRIVSVLSLVLAASIANAQEVREAGSQAGVSLGYAGIGDSGQAGVSGYGSSDWNFGQRWGMQGDLAAGALTGDDESQTFMGVGLHTYVHLLPNLSFGLYTGAGDGPDPQWTVGTELAFTPVRGFGFEFYFGETRGSGELEDGYATNKAIWLFWTTARDMRLGIYGRKDTLNPSGAEDRDYYLYGIHADMPVSSDSRTMVTANIGQVRLDAEGGVHAQAEIGVKRLLGRTGRRPTFAIERNVLPGLLLKR